ncbi:hypothetical protein Tco_1468342 [Tanacetum coccineum]
MQADISSIKGMVTGMFQAFKGISSSTPSEVRHDPDAPIHVPYEIHKKPYHLTEEEIHAHLDKEEKIEKVVKEAKLLEMNKSELIKDTEIKVHNKELFKKIKKSKETRKKRID